MKQQQLAGWWVGSWIAQSGLSWQGCASKASLGALLAIATLPLASPVTAAARLSSWDFDPASQVLSVTLPPGVTPRFLVFAEPARIVLEVPSTQLDRPLAEQTYGGAVRRVQGLQQNANTVHLVLELAPGTVIDRRHAELTSSAAGDRVQWTLRPLVVETGTAIASTPAPSPVATPEADPTLAGPRFIETPDGQLSIRASNLMLPSIGEGLANLPNTLPLDPFAPSLAPTDQVTVPPLDSTVAVTPNPPQVAVPPANAAPTAPEATGGAVASNSPTSPPSALQASDLDTSEAAPIAVVAPPTEAASPAAVSIEPPRPTAAPETLATAPTPEPETAISATPAAAPAASEVAPSATPPAPVATSVLTEEPPFLPLAAAPQQPAASPIVTLPPSESARQAAAAPPVPVAPAASGPVPFLATAPPNRSAPSGPDTVISFGQPLPGTETKAEQPSFPYLTPPTGAGAASNPDVLIPAGTLLQLRYPGLQPLQLDRQSRLPVEMLLAADLIDPKTGALIASAGSPVIGEFGPDELGLRWTSEAILLPGQSLALSGASAYFSGPPQVSGQRLAVNSGIGALALTVLTGFTGVGLLGGALMGATTAVGTAPQVIVVEPNQIIQVQVLEDVAQYRVGAYPGP